VPADTVVVAGILLDGNDDGIYPSNVIGMDSTSVSGASNVRSFAWLVPRLSPGNHVVQVYFSLSPMVEGVQGTAGSFSRTLTIGVYKP
jgi:hypothetical protein